MKKKIAGFSFFLMLSVSVWLVSGCNPNDNNKPSQKPKYTMQFNMTASGAAAFMDNTITTGTVKYYADMLRFYLGFPRLVKTDGTEVPLADLLIVKLDQKTPDNSICSSSFTFDIPEGSYKALRFGIGVPDTIVDTVKHYHYGATDPLRDGYGLMWPTPVNAFRNIVMNMYVDSTVAQKGPPAALTIFHIIKDDTTIQLYHTLEFPEVFTASKNGSRTAKLDLDLNKLFFNPSNPIDLPMAAKAGGTDMFKNVPYQIKLGIQFNDNFYAAVSHE